ncbi:DMT family transporter [Bacillus cytotoxicus]|uniref:Small multidrug resistance protein n=2 Tax=Bacillus cytotoxicus TaxID=580165 RepID=A0AAX2CC19_9BACI|nr:MULTISPECIES: multidrug efflux SMR transporter [Bacillus cereus group]ABS20670.1 small multidrug resistance protein [Bacillus cytotoxicus NVH 391-98]AWC27303.1 QacE family quaternary ammonium compound efflux SMR transporter [Bacillus cytotoxicus]AWC31340.1 QacE family quaternary ammonium compound efflux SMR transporter [Bacillus cytotoxicus]AWC35380.1 QacE family quaternary ammonium compound efflux SMR transporter [Bacillus cytotoxicus]AWC39416.1 QacE family quaternary ammonium compound eff
MIYWLLLLVTIIFEVAGTVAMKLSNGLTKFVPSVFIFVCYGICFSVFAIVVKKIHLSIAYAIWSGLGTLCITIISFCFFKEHISLFQAFCILFIVLGVIGLKVSSAT